MQADEETKFIRQASAIATGNDPSIRACHFKCVSSHNPVLSR